MTTEIWDLIDAVPGIKLENKGHLDCLIDIMTPFSSAPAMIGTIRCRAIRSAKRPLISYRDS